jgi:predicted secreted Zn-dependent protease
VHVLIFFTLPQWEKPQSVNRALVDEWKRYMDAVVAHEEGHMQLALAAAKEIRQAMLSQEWSAVSSEALREKIDVRCQMIVRECEAEQRRYDEATDHGRTQGARLRPVQ